MILFISILNILSLEEILGRIVHKGFPPGSGIFMCTMDSLKDSPKVDLFHLSSLSSILVSWTISLVVFLHIRLKTKKNIEEAEIYIRRVEAADLSAIEHIQYHKNEIEIEKSAFQVMKSLIIWLSIVRLPCKSFSILSNLQFLCSLYVFTFQI